MNQTFRCCNLRFALAAALLLAVLPGRAHAQGGCLTGGSGGCPTAPEVDPSLAGSGLALLGGVVLVLRARRGDR